jgi:hypothetical protein
LKSPRYRFEPSSLFNKELFGGPTRNGFDAPHATANSGFTQYEESADLPGSPDVSTATNLYAEGLAIGHSHHSDRIPIAISEECQRALSNGLGIGAFLG